jgi:hypothetical protein
VLATEVTEQVLAKKQIEENSEEIKKIASHLKLATDSAKLVFVVRPSFVKSWNGLTCIKKWDMTKVVKT